MTDDDRIALINDTTTIDSLDFALERFNKAHCADAIDSYSIGETPITAGDWQRHWAESDRMFDAMWNDASTQEAKC